MKVNIINCLLAITLFAALVGVSAANTDKRNGGAGNPSDAAEALHQKQSGQFVSIDFKDVDIGVFVKFISELTNKNFVIDQKVKGKVTIISPAKISIDEAYKVFESVLEVNGFGTVPAGEVIKVVPLPAARTRNIETRISDKGAAEDKLVTQLIPLKYADPVALKRLFAPLISKSSVVLAYEPTNILIVTDISSNIQRLLRILKVIDVADIGQEVSIIPLQYSDAPKMVTILESVFQVKRVAKQKLTGAEIKFVADERTNTIVVLASEVDTLRIKKMIVNLDKEVPRGKEKVRVHYLEYANSEEIAKTLESLQSKTGGTETAGKKMAPVVSEKVKITADKPTNSLVIMADQDDYKVISDIIAQLDIPRPMVYIESLIMEVNVSADFRLGTEWSFAGDAGTGGEEGVYYGGFGGGAGGGDPGYVITPDSSDGTTASDVLPPGFSLGIFQGELEIGGMVFRNIEAIIQAYQKDKDVHILSTPQILTTNNEEAKIMVGKNIPYQTKTSTSDNDTYNSYEYKDVGKSLTITPQISKDRMVRLDITLEVTQLESTEDFRPTTLKRTVDTTVIVKDANTVVIGGLIDDTFTNTEYQVPCLGSIPGLKWLFSSVSDVNDKTNLYIFLTPRVVNHPLESKELYNEKKDEIDKLREESIKMYKEYREPLEDLGIEIIEPGE